MRTITCFGDRTRGTLLKIARSYGPITFWTWMLLTALHLFVYSLTGNQNVARKEELIYEAIAALTSNAGHLGWQDMPSNTKRHLWHQNTIQLVHRDHLVGNRHLVPFFVFYTEFVMLGPHFRPESIFSTQFVMLSPRFIPEYERVGSKAD